MDRECCNVIWFKMERQERKCPRCASTEKQGNSGFTVAKSQRVFCFVCKHKYTPEQKKWAYTEEERLQAMKMLVNRGTGRGIGKQFGMHHSNAYRWAQEEQKKRK